jgi:hypothetical protein
MSHVNPAEGNAVVVRAEEAEQVGYMPQPIRLPEVQDRYDVHGATAQE